MRDKDIKHINIKRMMVVILSIFIIGLFLCLLRYDFFDAYSTRKKLGTVTYKEKLWTLQQQDTDESIEIEIPYFRQLEKGKVYTLSTTLTYDGSKDKAPYMFMHLAHVFCRVSLDGEVLFSCMPEDAESFRKVNSPGFIFKAISLPHDCKGKKLEIEMMPKLSSDMKYGLPRITFGDMESTCYVQFRNCLPFNVLIVICVILGISSILYSSMVFSGSRFREGFSIGVFSLMFSIYLITECEVDAYFIGNPYYTYVLNYFAFSLLPITLLAFMRERLPEKYFQLLSLAMVSNFLVFVVEILLHINRILDFREFISVLHIIYVVEMLLIMILSWKIKDRKKKSAFILQITPFFVGMIIDGLIYWLHWKIGISNASFTIIGVVIFLAIEIFHIFKSGIYVYGESIRSKTYQQMAYMDGLTGIANRRAYEEEIEEIEAEMKPYRSLMVVSADVNKLKFINDHYGHAAGDKLIFSFANIIDEEFGKYGRVFRTGGDEFVIFLYDVKVPQYEEMLKSARRKMMMFNEQNDFNMSVAIGYEIVKGKKVLKALKEADRKMYEEKERQGMQRMEKLNQET